MGEPTDTQEVSASMEDASARNCGEFLEEGASKGGNQPKVDEYTKYIDDELLVGPSQLGETAGDGIFTTRDIPKGTVICEYRGEAYDTFQAMRLEDKSYLMRLGKDSYIDAKNMPHVLARYINDCRNPCLYNVEFEKRPDQGFAFVVATRDILAEEELWVDYGKWYWLKLKPKRLAPRIAHDLLQRITAAPPQKAWTRWKATPLPNSATVSTNSAVAEPAENVSGADGVLLDVPATRDANDACAEESQGKLT
eukprot:INCI12805.1.p1 GENE.INCI12805.1~~INCI12805.1.p1  ORF type:complete len:252 (+),score=45.75 INCI12805.1:249-1004(+)